MIIVFTITQTVNKFKTSEVLQINMSEKFIECLSSEIPAMSSTTYKSLNTFLDI